MNTAKNFATMHLQLNRCVGSCNTLSDLSNKVCIANKTRFKSKCVQYDYRNK